MSKHYEFPGGVDILPGRNGDAVPSGAFRLVSIGGLPYVTQDGIAFTALETSAGGGVQTSAPVSGDGSVATPITIAAGAVTNPLLANMNANTVKGNNTGSPAAPSDLTEAAIAAMVGAGSSSTTTVAGTPAASLAVSGLNGNTDGDYLIYFSILAAGSGTSSINLEINDGAVTVYAPIITESTASTVTGSRINNTTLSFPSVAAGAFSGGWILLRSIASGPAGSRRFGCSFTYNDAGPSGQFQVFGIADITTNITKLSMVGAAASMDVGSFMTIRKLFSTS